MTKKKLLLTTVAAIVGAASIGGIAFASRYFNINEDPTFVQKSKGVYAYNDGNEDIIVLDSSDINNLKLYSDDWDTVLSGQFAPLYEGGHAYTVGELCVYNNRLYKCKTAFTSDAQHTWESGNFEPTTVKDMMDQLGVTAVSDMAKLLGDVEEYDPSKEYEAGTFASHNGKVYVSQGRVSNTGTSVTWGAVTGPFNESEWEEVSIYGLLEFCYAGTLKNGFELSIQEEATKKLAKNMSDAWAASKAYVAGDYVINNNALYRCTADHTSSADFATDTAKWESVKITDVLKTADDYKIDVSGGTSESDPYKLTITKAN